MTRLDNEGDEDNARGEPEMARSNGRAPARTLLGENFKLFQKKKIEIKN